MKESQNEVRFAAQPGRYLCFKLGHEEFATSLEKVKEVIALKETTPLPHAPPYVKGFMNLRGQVLAIIDLRVKLKTGKPESTAETTVIILDLAGLNLGVVVDSVDSVLTLDASQIGEPPAHPSSVNSEFVSGFAKLERSLTVILDLGKILNVNEAAALRAEVASAA